MKVRDYKDPLQLAIDIANDRVKVQVMWELEKKKRQKSELQQLLPMLSHADIQDALRELTEQGFLSQTVHKHRELGKVDYVVSNRGAKFLKCLRRFMDVGIEIMVDFHMEEQLMAEGYIEKIDNE